jgi:hypothetical protein
MEHIEGECAVWIDEGVAGDLRERLFVSQSDHGIDAHGAACGDVAGQERHRCEQRPGCEPRHRIRRACIVEQGRQYARKRECPASTESE